MRLLLVQHTNETPPGLCLSWLQSRGVSFSHVRLFQTPHLPSSADFDGLILCGGEMNVDEDAKFPWLKDERALIEAFMKSEKRILGLCLGAQLCAQVLGAPVYPHPKGWELGWWDIELQPTPSLAGFEEPAKLSVLHSHRYVFEAPQGSTLLAKNPWWENQGYLWNRQVMGFQFHPEAELDWNRECALDTDIPRGGQAQVAEEVLRLGELHQPQAARWFHRVLDGFFLNKVRFDRSL